MADTVMYRSLHPVQFLDDQTEGQLGSMGHAERQVFTPRPFWKWWCEDGPVDNCCCCFPLRTGIVLLSLSNLLSGVLHIFATNLAAYNISQIKMGCTEESKTEMCKMVLENMAENEFIFSCAPLLNAAGIVLIIFSLVGMSAACTGNAKFAKLYMKALPFLVVFVVVMMVLRVVMAPSTISTMVQVNFCEGIFFGLYYCKVAWSFYKRRKVMEDVQVAVDASSQGHTINLPLTQAPTVV